MIQKNDWMTNLLGIQWGDVFDTPNLSMLDGSWLLQWKIEATDVPHFMKAQELGFQLTETAIEFESEITTLQCPSSEVRAFQSSDKSAIAEINTICHQENPNFHSRFKNPFFFNADFAHEYFQLSTLNFLDKPNAITVVAEDDAGIYGFYILEKITENYYRGVMTGVLSRGRGKGIHIAMQLKCAEIIGHPYLVLNRTQISNYSIINNHIKQKRKLKKVEYLFLRKVNFV